MADKKEVLELCFGDGLFYTQIWKSADGKYHYDGPASNGPRHVRESGRGPHWVGEVDRKFVNTVLRILDNRQIEYKAKFA